MHRFDKFLATGWTVADSGCWEWNGYTNTRNKYGQMYAEKRSWKAHRVSYEFHVGPIPPGAEMMHLCDNPPCVNPNHLRPGTHADNIRDAASKGRLHMQKRTHCPRGHEYSPENSSRNKHGQLYCLICNRERCLRYYYSRKAAQRVK